MRLEKMFNQQMSLQKRLNNLEKIKDEKLRQQYINQMILACQEELIEIMRETAYKNPEYVEFGWKKGQSFNRDKMADEIIDLWHFVMNLCISINIDSNEFYERYCLKNKINFERQNNGY